MPGASSMRGVTGFRALDAINGALAQLIPTRVGAAGEGGNTLAVFGADRPDGSGRFIFYELVVGTWGGTPVGRRQRRPDEPGQPGGEHPGRGRRVRVPDRDRALRARARQRRRRPQPRRPRGRARLALPDARDLADRALRPGGAPALRARGRPAGHALVERPPPPRRHRGDPPVDVLDDDQRRATSTCIAWPAAAAGATRSSASPERVAADVIDGKVTREAALEHYGVASARTARSTTSEPEQERDGRR